MTVSIDWATKVITVPQSELTFISGTLYELDVDAFRLALKDIEDSTAGIVHPRTHNHNTQITLAGVTYARTVEIINGYTVTFENTGSNYTVRCVGANHNIGDVLNFNLVNLIIGNSAGLIAAGSAVLPSDVTDIAEAVWDELQVSHTTPGSTAETLKNVEDIVKILKTLGYAGLK